MALRRTRLHCDEEVADAHEQPPPEPTSAAATAAEPPTTPEHKLCCSPSAATYTDVGLLNARDCVVQHYQSHSIELTRTATATQLRSCTDADADGQVTRSEIVRMATDCGVFPESPPASTVTVESRRDMLRC
jgi:hypothetical protein